MIRLDRRYLVGIFSVVITMVLFIGIRLVPVNAQKEQSNLKKNYISVTIESGDTLWSIAEENMGIGYTDLKEYVQDIKEVNNLSSNTIHEGRSIIVPIYTVIENDYL